jgi:hypothetical protein
MMHGVVVTLGFVAQLAAGTVPPKGAAQAEAWPTPSGQPPAKPVQQPLPQLDASRFDSLTLLNLRAQLEIAVDNGLPTGPLIDRALEGAARRAGSAKILQVVRDHMAAMAHARDLLGAKSSTDELNTGADALKAGIEMRTLTAMRETRPAVGATVVPLTVLTDIVKRGVPEPAARDAVAAIAKMPSSDDALRGLQLTIAKNTIRGPGMAVDAMNRYLRGTISGATPLAAPVSPDRKPNRPPPP